MSDISTGSYEDHLLHGEIRYCGKWIKLTDCSTAQIEDMRDSLEEDYERSAGSQLERPIRQELRAIRHKLGPNNDPRKAFKWRIFCLIPKVVRVEWADKNHGAKQFETTIDDAQEQEWVRWVNRDMDKFARSMFDKSWGKLRIAYRTEPTDEAICHFKPEGAGVYQLDNRRVCRLVKGQFQRKDAISLFVWIRKDGKGRFPRTKSHAGSLPGDSYTNGAHLAAFYTSKARMAQRGWCEPGGGMIHELWQHARWVLKGKPICWQGFRPSVNCSKDWESIQQEVKAQGIVPSDKRHDEFWPSWFTWRMIARLKQHFGPRAGWTCPVA